MTTHRHLLMALGIGSLVFAMAAPSDVAAMADTTQLRADGSVRASVTVSDSRSLAIDLDLPTRTLRAGQPATASARITNVGEVAVEHVVARISFSETGVQILGQPEVEIGALAPGRTRQARWRLCSEVPANYIGIVQASYETNGMSATTQSKAQLLTVASAAGPRARTCPT